MEYTSLIFPGDKIDIFASVYPITAHHIRAAFLTS